MNISNSNHLSRINNLEFVAYFINHDAIFPYLFFFKQIQKIISLIVVLFYLIFLFHFISCIGVNLSLINDINQKKKKKEKKRERLKGKVRTGPEVPCRAPPKSTEKIKTLKKKIF